MSEHVCTEAGCETLAEKPRIDRVENSPNWYSRDGKIDHIVIHYTTSRNIEGSIAHFLHGTPRTSAHYIVGRDGALVQIVADTRAAWHAGNKAMNKRSIGIEHVAAPGDKLTPAQSAKSLALIAWLMDAYDVDRDKVIAHKCVKATSCYGDILADFGATAASDCATARVALGKWLATAGL